jgi:adenine phosphoribosyltransferase
MPSQPSTAFRRHPDLDPSYSSATTSQDLTDGSQGRLSTAATSSSAELSSLKMRLHSALRQFPDFPSPGILFEDILPIFQNPELHESLLRALEIHINTSYGNHFKPDVIVGLEARGFLFGPSLALRIGAAFVPVRKKGKLPGTVQTAAYQKEYGEDFFQMQQDAIRPGQVVLVVDDIIATGTFNCKTSMSGLIFSNFFYFPRWFGCSGWFARPTTWWHTPRLHFHSRTRLPQR